MSSSSRSSSAEVPRAVLEAYGFEPAELESEDGGLINLTFRVGAAGSEPRAVLQRLHPVFAGEVNRDIEALTRQLALAGLETPRIIPTRSGELWVESGGAWRALTYVPGHTLHAIESPEQADAAGELVGRFHRALAPLSDYRFHFARNGVHDTAAHLARLAAARRGEERFDEAAEARELAAEILDEATRRPHWPALPEHIAHGDLKISNVRFASLSPARARCLIDLDTLGRLPLPYELGDAMRSWCNARREDGEARFLVEIFAAAMRGYRRGSRGLCAAAELEAIPAGTQTVCIELAARFCVDVFADEYFAWDAATYPSRRAHNLVRARGQLALSRAVGRVRAELVEMIRREGVS